MNDADIKCRIDKWLWAARFFKTRSLATEAINGGKVHLHHERVKPGRIIKIGDELSIRRNDVLYEIVVKEIKLQRRPAKEACLMYEESEESINKRQQISAANKLLSAGRHFAKRPSKKERRKIVRFKREISE